MSGYIGPKQEVVEHLTRWILSTRRTVNHEMVSPSRDVDASDETIQSGNELITTLREIRQRVEDL